MNIKNFVKQFRFYTDVFLRGLGRTLYGTFIAGLIATSVYGFSLIHGENGYAAVFDFIASCGLLVLALFNMYVLGNKRRGGKK